MLEEGSSRAQDEARVTNVRERERPQALLLQEVLEVVVGRVAQPVAARAGSEQRVRGVQVLHELARVEHVVRESLVQGPAVVLATRVHEVELLSVARAHVADHEHAWVGVERVGVRVRRGPGLHQAARAVLGWQQRRAEGVAEAERPDARARRARRGRIVEGVGRQAVAGLGVDAQELAAVALQHLCAEVRGQSLRRRRDAVEQGLQPLTLGVVAVTGRDEQGAVLTEQQRARLVHRDHGQAARDVLADEHAPAAGHRDRIAPRDIGRVARDARDGRLVGRALLRVVARRTEVLQVVAVDLVQHEVVAVDQEVRVQREALEAVALVVGDLLGQVQQGQRRPGAVHDGPEAAGLLGDVDAPVRGEGQGDRLV